MHRVQRSLALGFLGPIHWEGSNVTRYQGFRTLPDCGGAFGQGQSGSARTRPFFLALWDT